MSNHADRLNPDEHVRNEVVEDRRPKIVRDQGSVLPMILALMVVGSLGVLALLTFATTLFNNRPPIEVRDRTFWSAKSAMSMAMTMQREHGPDGCYQPTDSFQLNGFTANVSCTPTGNYFGTGRGRFAVITTGNDPATSQLSGLGSTVPPKPLTGDVFVNGGSFGAPTADIAVVGNGTGITASVLTSTSPSTATPADRYLVTPPPPVPDPEEPVPEPPEDPPAPTPVPATCNDPLVEANMLFPNPGTAWSSVCQVEPWWNMAGDLTTSGATDEANDPGPYDYPELPPLPAYLRDSVAQASIGSCKVYFPGRYADALILGPGEHFFPSGVYYFAKELVLQPGAEVVAGEGRWGGCTFDAEAAFAPTAPTAHSITGKGATFLLGADGRIEATNASLRINRRVSDSTSRGTETIAIRSVNFSAAPTGAQAVEIPNDVVNVGDVYDAENPACNAALSTVVCLQDVAAHEAKATAASTPVKYTASSLTPADAIISFDQSDGDASSNQFVTDGYVFVPNAKVALIGGSNDDYRLRLTAGLVASSVEFAYERMPSNASNWFVGVLDEPIQRQVDLFVSVTAPNGQRTISRAIMEVNIDESYAINGWTVDPNAGTVTTVAAPTTTTPPTTPTTVEDPSTTSGATTTESTTTTSTTTTTTTLPPTTTTTLPPCGTADNRWTINYYNNRSLSGTSTGTQYINNLPFNVDWGGGGPSGVGVGSDDFSARFTRSVNLPEPGTYRFNVGSDDGQRLYVNGERVINDWNDQSYSNGQNHVDVEITDRCDVDIELHYYEKGGQARVSLDWERR